MWVSQFWPKMLNALFGRKPSWSKCMDLKCTSFFAYRPEPAFEGMSFREVLKINFQGVIQTQKNKAADTLTAEEHVTTKNLWFAMFWSWKQHKIGPTCFLLARTGLGQYLHGMEVSWDGTWFSKIGYEWGRDGTINQPVRHFLPHSMWTGRRPLPTGRVTQW